MYAQATTQTRATQTALTPQDVLAALKAGNERFVSGQMLERDLRAQVQHSASGQYPMAAIVGCIDSRVPPELIFDMGIGDLFVARVAGNYVDNDMLGSLEFATQIAGAKAIVLLGHTDCAAIQGACDRLRIGNLSYTLSHLVPAINAVRDLEGPRNSSNKEFVDAVTRANVELNVRAIAERGTIVGDLVQAGNLKIAGGIYNLETGRVTFLK